MAAFSINTPLWLQPWAGEGLEYLVFPTDLPTPWSLTQEESSRPTQTRPLRHTTTPEQRPTPNGLRYLAENCRKTAAAHDVSYADDDVDVPPVKKSVSEPELETKKNIPIVQTSANLPQPEQWPTIWQERLRQAKKGRVLWTYWALGNDLCGTPNKQRRNFFQQLITDLAHPVGTHTFWPCALPQKQTTAGEEALIPTPEIFWSGVHLLKARVVIIMGSAAMKAVHLPSPLPLMGQTRYRGCLVQVVRDVDALLEQPQYYGAMLEFLRQNLQRIVR